MCVEIGAKSDAEVAIVRTFLGLLDVVLAAQLVERENRVVSGVVGVVDSRAVGRVFRVVGVDGEVVGD